MVDCVLFSRCHGAAAGTLCPWFDGHCSGALVSGPACAENCRLGIVGHFRRFFHLFRQPCSNGSCPHTVRSPFVPRDHAGLRAYLPDHQQCSCCYSAQPLHAGCTRASGRHQCWRSRDSCGVSCKPHYVSGIYAPRSRWRKEFFSPVFWDQLCVSGDSFDCYVRSGLVSLAIADMQFCGSSYCMSGECTA